MVAQLAGNLRGYRLWQGVAGTSLLPGHAVYTMPETLSLFLCNCLVLRIVSTPRTRSKRSDPEYQTIMSGIRERWESYKREFDTGP